MSTDLTAARERLSHAADGMGTLDLGPGGASVPGSVRWQLAADIRLVLHALDAKEDPRTPSERLRDYYNPPAPSTPAEPDDDHAYNMELSRPVFREFAESRGIPPVSPASSVTVNEADVDRAEYMYEHGPHYGPAHPAALRRVLEDYASRHAPASTVLAAVRRIMEMSHAEICVAWTEAGREWDGKTSIQAARCSLIHDAINANRIAASIGAEK